jgi:hypothetical protein
MNQPEQKIPRINVYRCEYGCNNVTVDVDKGVTPFMIKCVTKAKPGRPLNPLLTDKNGECKGTATSCFYPKGPKPAHIGEPTHEWAIPSEEEIAAEVKAGIEHIKASAAMPFTDEDLKAFENQVRADFKKGQLILRPRTDREPVYHDIP